MLYNLNINRKEKFRGLGDYYESKINNFIIYINMFQIIAC